jgi:hypothetical protein
VWGINLSLIKTGHNTCQSEKITKIVRWFLFLANC